MKPTEMAFPLYNYLQTDQSMDTSDDKCFSDSVVNDDTATPTFYGGNEYSPVVWNGSVVNN